MQISTALREALKESSKLLEEKIDLLLPQVTKGKVGESRLAEAMRYSSLSGGKRLRPFLVMASAGLFGVGKTSSMQTAAAIEFIHTYSLIHDDLPAIDNDDTRRGKPSSHKKFDEATAILAGDALLTYAFEVLADPSTHSDPGVRAELVLSVARACGFKGMVGGQMMDIISEEREMTIEETTRLQRMKTGELFAIACEAGAILGKAPFPIRNALRGYALGLGLAFQITDDILDAEGTQKGSKTRQDKSSGKATYVHAMGLDKAKKQAEMLASQATSHLDVFGKKAQLLKELTEFVVSRKK